MRHSSMVSTVTIKRLLICYLMALGLLLSLRGAAADSSVTATNCSELLEGTNTSTLGEVVTQLATLHADLFSPNNPVSTLLRNQIFWDSRLEAAASYLALSKEELALLVKRLDSLPGSQERILDAVRLKQGENEVAQRQGKTLQLYSVCDRNEVIRVAIEKALDNKPCKEIEPTDLEAIEELSCSSLAGWGPIKIVATDFYGLPKLKKLSFHFGDDLDLPRDVFQHVSGLESFTFWGVGIRNLTSAHLAPLPELTEIKLNHGELDNLDDDFFVNSPKLVQINLVANNLKGLPRSIGALKNLRFLDVNINAIETLPENLFAHTPLTSLTLSNNPLKDLGFIAGQKLATLEWLYLISTTLESVPENLLDGKKLLRGLNLSYNHLKELPVNFFKDTRQLQELDLTQNSFEVVPFESLMNAPSGIKVHLQSNPLSSPVDFRSPQLAQKGITVYR